MKLKVLICAFACLKDPDTRFGFGKGGESGLGWNLVLQIAKFGECFVLTDISNKDLIEEKLFEDKVSGIRFYYIGLPKFLSPTKKIIQIYAYLWQVKAYFFARKLHKEIKFDFFHHLTYANDWMASYVGAFLPVKYIRGPGGGAHRVPKKFAMEYPFKDQMSQKIRSIGQWIFRHDPVFIIGQNKAKAILICNNEAFEALPGKWQKKAYFFPVNGISSDDLLLLGKEEKNMTGKFLILTAGKLIRIKGFDLAVKSFRIFNDKVPKSKLIIAGDGPELANLTALVEKLGLAEKVIFKKWLSRKDLLIEMARADVFLFSSLRDGGGAVVVEAMAAGKPVVCFDISGPGFHVDQNCGIKIKSSSPKQSVQDFSKALEKLNQDSLFCDKLGKNAKQKVKNYYNWDKLGEQLEKIYEKVLNEK